MTYQKGYYLDKQQKEYGLERPTKIHLLTERITEKLPDAINEKNALIAYIMKTNKGWFYLANNRPYEEWYIK